MAFQAFMIYLAAIMVVGIGLIFDLIATIPDDHNGAILLSPSDDQLMKTQVRRRT